MSQTWTGYRAAITKWYSWIVCEGGEHGTGVKFDGLVEGEKAILKKVKNQWVSLEVSFPF